jgi:8-oxo-dGTP pyrophosphatase MutT (NUDIX family)
MKIATLALIIKNDFILLGSKQGKPEIGAGTLNGPGGKMEVGETPLECVIRETEEEVGIQLIPEQTKKIAIVTFYAEGVADFEVHVFRSYAFTGEPKETESMIPHWFPMTEIPYDRMLESDSHWLPRALAGEPFSANVYYTTRGEGFQKVEFLPFNESH